MHFPGFCWAIWHSRWMGYRSMADSRPKSPQLRLGHLWVSELQPLSPMYSTRPCCLVQAITQHLCGIQIWIRKTACLIRPTLHLVGQWVAQTSRVRVSARAQPSPPLNPHYNHWPCVWSCLVGGSNKYLYIHAHIIYKICQFFLFQRKKKVNILKWIGP